MATFHFYLQSLHVCADRCHDVMNFKLNGSVEITDSVATIDAQWEGMGDVGLARYKRALLPPCPTIRVLNYRN